MLTTVSLWITLYIWKVINTEYINLWVNKGHLLSEGETQNWNEHNKNKKDECNTKHIYRYVFSCVRKARVAQWDKSLDLTAHISLSPIRHGFAPSFVNYKIGCTRLTAASDTVYQLLAHDRWFSPGTPASSTTKTGRHDIAEILLKMALNTNNSNYCVRFYSSTWVLNHLVSV